LVYPNTYILDDTFIRRRLPRAKAEEEEKFYEKMEKEIGSHEKEMMFFSMKGGCLLAL
jgi:hypothetical protein